MKKKALLVLDFVRHNSCPCKKLSCLGNKDMQVNFIHHTRAPKHKNSSSSSQNTANKKKIQPAYVTLFTVFCRPKTKVHKLRGDLGVREKGSSGTHHLSRSGAHCLFCFHNEFFFFFFPHFTRVPGTVREGGPPRPTPRKSCPPSGCSRSKGTPPTRTQSLCSVPRDWESS